MTATPIEPGTVVGGKYRLDRMLGQGGMGSVFAAENTLTGKQVAIKCMNRELASNAEASQRFVREAKASARIRHPNVVDVYDVITENGAFYLVMEYLEGESMGALMMRETTPLHHLIRVLIGAMRGVAAAHRTGVIHRDIKPENIFLAVEGDDQHIVPKVLDFGISKLQDTQDFQLTAPGATLGTVLYMSTEQLTGAADIDARADVYAFGVILYQAITGRPPFESETLPGLIARIMTEQAQPVKRVRPDVPTKLSLLVQVAMAKQREDRLPNLEAFISQLEPFADETKFRDQMTLPSDRPPAIRTPHSGPPAAAAVAAAQPFASTPAAAQAREATPFAASEARESQPSIPRTSLRPLWILVGAAVLLLAWWLLRDPTIAARHETVPPASAPASTPQSATLVPVPDNSNKRNDPPPSAAGAPPIRLEPVADAPEPKSAPTAVSTPPARPVSAPPVVKKLTPSVAAPPPPAAGPPAVAAPPTAPRTKPPAKPGCNPNFYFDAQGDKHFKPECF